MIVGSVSGAAGGGVTQLLSSQPAAAAATTAAQCLKDRLVMVAALAVHVAVLEFFGAGFTHVGDLDVEVQVFAG